MREQQIYIIIVIADLHTILFSNKSKILTNFKYKIL